MQRNQHCLFWPLLFLERLSYHARKMRIKTEADVRITAPEVVPDHVPEDVTAAVLVTAMMDARQIAGMDVIVGKSRTYVL